MAGPLTRPRGQTVGVTCPAYHSIWAVYDDWAVFVDLAPTVTTGTGPLVEADLRCPVPTPRQVFAIGLSYRSHATESGMAIPEVPATFTKFPASLAGPFDDIQIAGDSIGLGGRARPSSPCCPAT